MLISWSKSPSQLEHRLFGGLKPTLHIPSPQAGFTLLELLVAMVIISLLTAVVGFSVSGSSQRTLKGEGDKLAARLNAAHAQMNAGASPLRLVAITTGEQSSYAFETTARADDGSASASWKRVEKDEVLAARSLPSGSSLQLTEPLLIAREPITAPASVLLVQGEVQVRIATDGINGWVAQ